MNSASVRPILGAPPRKSAVNGAVLREQFFRSLLESISDRLCVLDRNGVVVYINCSQGAFSASPKDKLSKLALGSNYLTATEAAVRNGAFLARERLNGVLAVLQRRRAHFELRYPCPGEDSPKDVLMVIEPMPEEHGGVIIRLLDVPKMETKSCPGKSGDPERPETRSAEVGIAMKSRRDRYGLGPSAAAVPLLHANGLHPRRMDILTGITEQKKLNRASKDLDRRLVLAQEDERKRIARELHDDISQSLALCMLTLDRILDAPEGLQSPIRSQMVSLHKTLGIIASDVHRISHNLCPSNLVQLGLVPALRRLLKDFSAHKEINVDLQSENVPSTISQEATIGLFRIAQECLNNIAKHSGANSATVSIKGKHEGIELTVSDSGVGFDPGCLEESSGLGIRNIQERVDIVGGRFKIKSKPQCGTTISVWIDTK